MPLNIFVQVWTEIDSTLNVSIDRATGDARAETGDELRRISPCGRQGMAIAVEIPSSEVTAFAVGHQHVEALRHALAAGATRSVELLMADDLDQRALITTLAQWLENQQPDLVVGDRLVGLVAGQLRWSHLAGLENLQIAESQLHAIRHLGRGDRESVVAAMPAAVRLWPTADGPPYVSRDRLRAIEDRRIERTTLPVAAPDTVVEVGDLQIARTRTRKSANAPQQSARGMDRLQTLIGAAGGRADSKPGTAIARNASPDELADEFVRYLAHHDLLPEHQLDVRIGN